MESVGPQPGGQAFGGWVSCARQIRQGLVCVTLAQALDVVRETCLSLWWKKPLLPDQEGRCVLDRPQSRFDLRYPRQGIYT